MGENNNCPEVSKPKVNEESKECCEITPSNCVKTSEAVPTLGIGIGKTLTYVIAVIAKAIKKNKQEIDTLKERLKYKNYEVLVTQTSTNVPTVNVGVNELASTVVITRSSIGEYMITSTAAFTANMTFIYIGTFNSNLDQVVKAYRIDDNNIKVETFEAGVLADDVLNKTPLKITMHYV